MWRSDGVSTPSRPSKLTPRSTPSRILSGSTSGRRARRPLKCPVHRTTVMLTPSASSSAIIRSTRDVTLRLPTKTDEPSVRRVTSTSSSDSGASCAISSPPRPSRAPRSTISTSGPSTSAIAGTTSTRGAWPIVTMPTLGFIGRHDSIGLHIAREVTSMKPTSQLLEHLYRTMVRIRRFDEKTTELFQAGLVKGTAHSYRSEEHTSELQSRQYLVCRLLLEKK